MAFSDAAACASSYESGYGSAVALAAAIAASPARTPSSDTSCVLPSYSCRPLYSRASAICRSQMARTRGERSIAPDVTPPPASGLGLGGRTPGALATAHRHDGEHLRAGQGAGREVLLDIAWLRLIGREHPQPAGGDGGARRCRVVGGLRHLQPGVGVTFGIQPDRSRSELRVPLGRRPDLPAGPV